MLTIKTNPDCTLGFVKLNPDGIDAKKYFKTSTIFYLDQEELVWLRDNNYPDVSFIGRLSEITEDQAKELLDSFIVNGFCCYKDYIDPANAYFGASVLMSLKSAALSVGIEEKDFDKYLVVKL